MSETVTQTVFCPITGTEHEVELATEDHASTMLPCDESYEERGIQVDYRCPSDSQDTWFEVYWSLERVDGDETKIESDKEIAMYCPRCGEKRVVSFVQNAEFEALPNSCDSCGDSVHMIRDQPIESGQSHIINYEYHIYE